MNGIDALRLASLVDIFDMEGNSMLKGGNRDSGDQASSQRIIRLALWPGQYIADVTNATLGTESFYEGFNFISTASSAVKSGAGLVYSMQTLLSQENAHQVLPSWLVESVVLGGSAALRSSGTDGQGVSDQRRATCLIGHSESAMAHQTPTWAM